KFITISYICIGLLIQNLQYNLSDLQLFFIQSGEFINPSFFILCTKFIIIMDFKTFSDRHIGPDSHELKGLLEKVGYSSLDDLADQVVPEDIRERRALNLPEALSEREYLEHIQEVSKKNKVWRSFIGQGYYGTITPSVIQRNLFENPGWYTQYTPYQAEISQGRLESLLNFQTIVSDLTGLPIANASLLDEGTAAAEAMSLFF